MRIALAFLIPSLLAATDVKTLFEKGQAALAARDIASARTYYAQACSSPGSDTLLAQAICEHVNGVLDNSELHYRKALIIWENLAPAYPDFHATTLICLADLLSASHHATEAESLLADARGIAVAPAVAASIGSHLGAVYARSEQPERGRPLLTEALEKLESLEPSPKHEIAWAYNTLGTIDLNAGHYAEAETSIRKALAIEDKTEYQSNLAAAFNLEGKVDQAEILLRRVRSTFEAEYGPGSLEVALVSSNLGVVESTRGKFGTAEDLSQQALAVFRRERGPDSYDAVAAEVNLGAVYLRQHKTVEAAKALPDEARLGQFLNGDPRLLADGIRQLADLRTQQRRWKEADVLYRKAIGLYAERLGANHPDLAGIRHDYAAMAKAGHLPGHNAAHPNQT
jgi:tetratricopeptide (TPR) repeat protein